MAESKLYSAFWKKQMPLIRQYLKMTSKGQQEIKLHKSDFKVAGDRNKYAFNLILNKGIVGNNVDSSAVARDLADALQTTADVKSWLVDHNVTIRLDSNFVLKMAQIVPPAPVVVVAAETASTMDTAPVEETAPTEATEGNAPDATEIAEA